MTTTKQTASCTGCTNDSTVVLPLSSFDPRYSFPIESERHNGAKRSPLANLDLAKKHTNPFMVEVLKPNVPILEFIQFEKSLPNLIPSTLRSHVFLCTGDLRAHLYGHKFCDCKVEILSIYSHDKGLYYIVNICDARLAISLDWLLVTPSFNLPKFTRLKTACHRCYHLLKKQLLILKKSEKEDCPEDLTADGDVESNPGPYKTMIFYAKPKPKVHWDIKYCKYYFIISIALSGNVEKNPGPIGDFYEDEYDQMPGEDCWPSLRAKWLKKSHSLGGLHMAMQMDLDGLILFMCWRCGSWRIGLHEHDTQVEWCRFCCEDISTYRYGYWNHSYDVEIALKEEWAMEQEGYQSYFQWLPEELGCEIIGMMGSYNYKSGWEGWPSWSEMAIIRMCRKWWPEGDFVSKFPTVIQIGGDDITLSEGHYLQNRDYYSSSEDMWVPDLTEEGVEPNPGPPFFATDPFVYTEWYEYYSAQHCPNPDDLTRFAKEMMRQAEAPNHWCVDCDSGCDGRHSLAWYAGLMQYLFEELNKTQSSKGKERKSSKRARTDSGCGWKEPSYHKPPSDQGRKAGPDDYDRIDKLIRTELANRNVTMNDAEFKILKDCYNANNLYCPHLKQMVQGTCHSNHSKIFRLRSTINAFKAGAWKPGFMAGSSTGDIPKEEPKAHASTQPRKSQARAKNTTFQRSHPRSSRSKAAPAPEPCLPKRWRFLERWWSRFRLSDEVGGGVGLSAELLDFWATQPEGDELLVVGWAEFAYFSAHPLPTVRPNSFDREDVTFRKGLLTRPEVVKWILGPQPYANKMGFFFNELWLPEHFESLERIGYTPRYCHGEFCLYEFAPDQPWYYLEPRFSLRVVPKTPLMRALWTSEDLTDVTVIVDLSCPSLFLDLLQVSDGSYSVAGRKCRALGYSFSEYWSMVIEGTVLYQGWMAARSNNRQMIAAHTTTEAIRFLRFWITNSRIIEGFESVMRHEDPTKEKDHGLKPNSRPDHERNFPGSSPHTRDPDRFSKYWENLKNYFVGPDEEEEWDLSNFDPRLYKDMYGEDAPECCKVGQACWCAGNGYRNLYTTTFIYDPILCVCGETTPQCKCHCQEMEEPNPEPSSIPKDSSSISVLPCQSIDPFFFEPIDSSQFSILDPTDPSPVFFESEPSIDWESFFPIGPSVPQGIRPPDPSDLSKIIERCSEEVNRLFTELFICPTCNGWPCGCLIIFDRYEKEIGTLIGIRQRDISAEVEQKFSNLRKTLEDTDLLPELRHFVSKTQGDAIIYLAEWFNLPWDKWAEGPPALRAVAANVKVQIGGWLHTQLHLAQNSLRMFTDLFWDDSTSAEVFIEQLSRCMAVLVQSGASDLRKGSAQCHLWDERSEIFDLRSLEAEWQASCASHFYNPLSQYGEGISSVNCTGNFVLASPIISQMDTTVTIEGNTFSIYEEPPYDKERLQVQAFFEPLQRAFVRPECLYWVYIFDLYVPSPHASLWTTVYRCGKTPPKADPINMKSFQTFATLFYAELARNMVVDFRCPNWEGLTPEVLLQTMENMAKKQAALRYDDYMAAFNGEKKVDSHHNNAFVKADENPGGRKPRHIFNASHWAFQGLQPVLFDIKKCLKQEKLVSYQGFEFLMPTAHVYKYGKYTVHVTYMADTDQLQDAYWVHQALQAEEGHIHIAVGGDDNTSFMMIKGILYQIEGDISMCDQSMHKGITSLYLTFFDLLGASPEFLKILNEAYNKPCIFFYKFDHETPPVVVAIINFLVWMLMTGDPQTSIGNTLALFPIVAWALTWLASWLEERSSTSSNSDLCDLLAAKFANIGIKMKLAIYTSHYPMVTFHKKYFLRQNDGTITASFLPGCSLPRMLRVRTSTVMNVETFWKRIGEGLSSRLPVVAHPRLRRWMERHSLGEWQPGELLHKGVSGVNVGEKYANLGELDHEDFWKLRYGITDMDIELIFSFLEELDKGIYYDCRAHEHVKDVLTKMWDIDNA